MKPPSSPPSDAVNRPYRKGIEPNKMDMGAFVNDLKSFWLEVTPKPSAASSSRGGASSMIYSVLLALAVCAWAAACTAGA